jgi:mono/diheme cytochrome c family protein
MCENEDCLMSEPAKTNAIFIRFVRLATVASAVLVAGFRFGFDLPLTEAEAPPASFKTDCPPSATPLTAQPDEASEKKSPSRQASTAKTHAPVADAATFRETVQPFFTKHCVDCHGEDLAEGKLRLDTLAADFFSREPAGKWVEILDRLNLGEMPPKDEPRPDVEELAKVTDWITSELGRVTSLASSTGGRVVLRRLTRNEYANTVRDLFGITFFEGEGPQEMLPPDGSIKGFNKLSKALLLDPSLMEKYIVVARYVVEKAVATRPPKAPSRTVRFEFEDTPDTAMSYIVEGRHADLTKDGMVLYQSNARTFAKLLHPYNDKQTPVDGEYIVRVRAGARPGSDGKPVYMDIKKGANGLIGRILVDAPIDQPQVYEARAVLSAALDGELGVGIVNGARFTDPNFVGMLLGSTADKEFQAGNRKKASQLRARARAEGVYSANYHRSQFTKAALDLEKLPKLLVDYVELEGPVSGRWPPDSRKQIYEPLGSNHPEAGEEYEPENAADSVAAARKIIARFLPIAFRRPVSNAEIDAVVGVFEEETRNDKTFEEALKTSLVAMLCSPDFLYLFEPVGPETPEDQRRLTDTEFASRLSYFLWSSMPDAELSEAAASGRLRNDDVLTAQVDRMIRDARADALVDDFAAQWLKISEFDRFEPDRRIFPDYYANRFVGIGKEMRREPLAFFREVLRHDLSVLSFLDSDWTMANKKLADWYGISGVKGKEFQRISFPADSPRGGLIAMAGVAKWGSDGNRTKPVERGKYILDVLFNDPPPPPPPNAGEVEPNLAGQILTVRERLEKHRHVASCRNCHRRIDPYGLALENFNVIGQWRDKLDGEKPLREWGNNRPKIDCEGTLPNGTEYSSFAEFKQSLVAQSNRFERALAEKLFMYALGRTLEAGDRSVILSLVTQMQASDHTLRSLIHGIVKTEAFGTK